MAVGYIGEFDIMYGSYENPYKSSAYKGGALNSLSADEKSPAKKIKLLKKSLKNGEIDKDKYDEEIAIIEQKIKENVNKRKLSSKKRKPKELFIDYGVVSNGNNKVKIDIVIIDDVEKIRSKIKNLLPDVLDEYDINFIEFDNYEDAKDHFKYTFGFNEKVFYILDNNFYKEGLDEDEIKNILRKVRANMGVELYNWIKENKPDFIENIAIFSSYEKNELMKKFDDKNLQIIPGKDFMYADDVHINAIARFVENRLKK